MFGKFCVCLSVCLSICLSICQDSVFYLVDTISDLIFLLDIAVSLRISFYEEGCLVSSVSVCLSVCLSICLSICQDSVFYLLDTISDLIFLLDIAVSLRIYFYEEEYLVSSVSVCLSVYLSVYVSVCLSVRTPCFIF